LQSIYGDESIRLWKPNQNDGKNARNSSEGWIRYEVHVDLPPPHDTADTRLRILVSLTQSYPSTSPPQLQLLSRYIGPYLVDHALFGSVLRTFISHDGVEWLPDSVCVFDGVENVRERCLRWYSDCLSTEKVNELLRADDKEIPENIAVDRDDGEDLSIVQSTYGNNTIPRSIPDDIQLAEAEPITDRKSVFVGRACRITDPSQVPAVLSILMSDRRIARAAHPIINAWRCRVNSTLHQDNDDDGESAAGGRLAHLLQILDVEDVLVIVTRYFGGIHLGPDRFKHINQAARNALEVGGFLDTDDDRKGSSRLKKRQK